MSRIHQAFENKKAFIAFVTGGDPDLETTEKLVIAMEEAGADLIEIGIPFSDPIAEGVVIQEANIRALSAGCTTDKLFETVKRAREKVTVPMVFLTYINPIYTYGKEKFMRRCAECGIDGLIIPDLPFEEKGELLDVCRAYGIDIISLVAPTSHERIRMIAEKAQGFLYVVSSMGVTGVRSKIETNLRHKANGLFHQRIFSRAVIITDNRRRAIGHRHHRRLSNFPDGINHRHNADIKVAAVNRKHGITCNLHQSVGEGHDKGRRP